MVQSIGQVAASLNVTVSKVHYAIKTREIKATQTLPNGTRLFDDEGVKEIEAALQSIEQNKPKQTT